MSIPVEYLLECSRNILGEYQLLKLDKAAQLKRELREKQEKMIDLMVEAAFAMWLRENRESILALCSPVVVEKGAEDGS